MEEEVDNQHSNSDSEMSDASSGGYEADVDTSDSDEAPDTEEEEDDEEEENDEEEEGMEEEDEEAEEFWQKYFVELSAIADEQEECNRPEE